jgi:hypothetical protein
MGWFVGGKKKPPGGGGFLGARCDFDFSSSATHPPAVQVGDKTNSGCGKSTSWCN